MAITWLAKATAQELYHVARFHVLESLVTSIPKEEMPDFRYRVTWHQYHCMHWGGLASQSPYATRTFNDATGPDLGDGRMAHSHSSLSIEASSHGSTPGLTMPLQPKNDATNLPLGARQNQNATEGWRKIASDVFSSLGISEVSARHVGWKIYCINTSDAGNHAKIFGSNLSIPCFVFE